MKLKQAINNMKTMQNNSIIKDLTNLVEQANQSEIEYVLEYMQKKLSPKESKTFNIQIMNAKQAADVVGFFRSINFSIDETLVNEALRFELNDIFASNNELLYFQADYINNVLSTFTMDVKTQEQAKSYSDKKVYAENFLSTQINNMKVLMRPSQNIVNYYNSDEELIFKIENKTKIYVSEIKIFYPIQNILEYHDTDIYYFILEFLNKNLHWNFTTIETINE